MSTASFQQLFFCGFSHGVANDNRLSLLPPTVNTNQLHRPSKVSYCVWCVVCVPVWSEDASVCGSTSHSLCVMAVWPVPPHSTELQNVLSTEKKNKVNFAQHIQSQVTIIKY